jgi:tetratricopeptide (TPR) repeat protein
VSSVPLGVLHREESVALLRKHRADLAADDPDLNAIAEELGDLPLALHLAGRFLERYRHAPFGTPGDYLSEVRRPDLLKHRSLTVGGRSPTGHEQDVARTFALSYDRLKPEDGIDRSALALLSRVAWFAPGEPVPRDLLRLSAGLAADDADAAMGFEDGLERLSSLGLLENQQQGSLVLHRLLADFVRTAAGDAVEAREAVEGALLAGARNINQAGYPGPLVAWQLHLRAVAEQADETSGENAASLLNSLGYHLKAIADFTGARGAFERALAIDEAAFGPDHPAVAIDVNNLGDVLKDLGDLAGARGAFGRALAIFEQVLGSEHPNVATLVNNLGFVLQALGDLAGARGAYERALAIGEKTFGKDHPQVAIYVNNLGGVLQALGDVAGARGAFERALAIRETVFGAEHPDVAMTEWHLGALCRDEGQTQDARRHLQRALDTFLKVLPEDHSYVKGVREYLDALDR